MSIYPLAGPASCRWPIRAAASSPHRIRHAEWRNTTRADLHAILLGRPAAPGRSPYGRPRRLALGCPRSAGRRRRLLATPSDRESRCSRSHSAASVFKQAARSSAIPLVPQNQSAARRLPLPPIRWWTWGPARRRHPPAKDLRDLARAIPPHTRLGQTRRAATPWPWSRYPRASRFSDPGAAAAAAGRITKQGSRSVGRGQVVAAGDLLAAQMAQRFGYQVRRSSRQPRGQTPE
jgi:hypothetical protein